MKKTLRIVSCIVAAAVLAIDVWQLVEYERE